MRSKAGNGKLGSALLETHTGDKVWVKLDTGMEKQETTPQPSVLCEKTRLTAVTAQL